MHPDDERLSDLVRLIRRELRISQVQLAAVAHVPLNDLKRIEAGKAGYVRLNRVRRVLEAEGGRARLVPWWNGAAADRLLDSRHAALVERVVALLKARGWEVQVEVSFSEFGERGSIDILALKPDARVAIMIEVKTAIGSLEETNRVLDAKVRLAPILISKRYGWRPAIVGRLLVVPSTSTVRRVVDAHASTMESIYPARSREVRAWLRRPTSPVSGIWFVSDGRNASSVSA
jgi:hypothetical protein